MARMMVVDGRRGGEKKQDSPPKAAQHAKRVIEGVADDRSLEPAAVLLVLGRIEVRPAPRSERGAVGFRKKRRHGHPGPGPLQIETAVIGPSQLAVCDA